MVLFARLSIRALALLSLFADLRLGGTGVIGGETPKLSDVHVEFITDDDDNKDAVDRDGENESKNDDNVRIFGKAPIPSSSSNFAADFLRSLGYEPEKLLKAVQLADVAFLKRLKWVIRRKVAPLVSAACVGDLVYHADTLIEYAAVRYELSNKCKSPTIALTKSSKSSEIDNRSVSESTIDNRSISDSSSIDNRSMNCECVRDAEQHLHENEWALDVIDSFGKYPTGILYANFWLTGDYEQCTQIDVPKSSPHHKWRGQYCRIDLSAYEDTLYVNISSLMELDLQKNILSIDPSEVLLLSGSRINNGRKCSSSKALKIGACFPKSCSKSDVESILGFMINLPQRGVGKKVICHTEVSCHKDLDISQDNGAIIVLLVVMAIATLMIFGTCYDYYVYREVVKKMPEATLNDTSDRQAFQFQQKYNSIVAENREEYFNRQATFVKVVLAFSVYSNGKKIFNFEQKPGQIHCIHGLKALCLSWIILAHTYYWATKYIDNLLVAFDLINEISNQFIMNASVAVDSFYTISYLVGFSATLLVLLWMKDAKKTRGKHVLSYSRWGLIYLHRYLRLTPVYMFIMVVDIFLYRYLSDGPLWNQNGIEPNYCQNSWWTNVLYVNNFFKLDEQCMTWSWYLATDMQFFVLSPPLLIILWKYKKIGVALIGLIIFITSMLRMAIILHSPLGYPPISLLLNDLSKFSIIEDFWNEVYVKPYCRCGPYLVGLLLGFLLSETNQKANLKKWQNYLGWASCTAIGFGIVFGLYDYARTAQINIVGKAIYAAFGRTFWGLIICWIIFACATGNGGLMNTFLSWKLWMPLSRLVYCSYLVHPIVILFFYSTQMRPVHFSGHTMIICWFLTSLILSFAVALVFSLALEMPVQSLEKLLFQRPVRRTKRELYNSVNNTVESGQNQHLCAEQPNCSQNGHTVDKIEFCPITTSSFSNDKRKIDTC